MGGRVNSAERVYNHSFPMDDAFFMNQMWIWRMDMQTTTNAQMPPTTLAHSQESHSKCVLENRLLQFIQQSNKFQRYAI